MKYLTFRDGAEQKFGVLHRKKVIELTVQGFPPTLLEFISAGEKTWAAAAISVTRHEAQPSLPTRKEINEFSGGKK